MMQRVTNTIAYLAVAAMFVGVVCMYRVFFFEKPAVSYRNLPFPLQSYSLRPGDFVPVLVERCSSAHVAMPYEMTHAIEGLDSHLYYELPVAHVSIEPGCAPPTTPNRMHKLPLDIPPGRYRLFGTSSVWGEREHVVPWYSQPFEVAE